MTGSQRTLDDLGRFRDIQTACRLGDTSQGDISQPGVVGKSVVFEVCDAYDLQGGLLGAYGRAPKTYPKTTRVTLR